MAQDINNKDKWTCPNDRHLQLRAKLNAGWSYHTEPNTKFINNKTSQLSENEIIAIQKVLERSEMLEKIEQERVSKLVDRLENLKKHALKTTITPQSNCCAICGDYFYLLRSTPYSCNICQKLLCSKCCIDTLYTPEDKNSFINVSNNIQFRSNNNNNNNNNNQQQILWLCRICSEQRELWKKSGAWFFKKFPSYISSNFKPFSNFFSNKNNIDELQQNNNNNNNNKPITTTSPVTTPVTTLPINSISNTNNIPMLLSNTQRDHQVSFSMPPTPIKQNSLSRQNSPNRLIWQTTREDIHKNDSDISDSNDNETSSNDTTLEFNNNNNNNNQLQNIQQTSNHILTNGHLSITNYTNSNNNINSINNNNNNKNIYQSNTSINNINLHRVNTLSRNSSINILSSTTIIQNNNNNNNNINLINGINNHNNSGGVSSTPNSPKSRTNSNVNLPSSLSLKTPSNNDIQQKQILKSQTTTATTSTPKQSRKSFRKPKLFEWCSNQFSFDFGSNSNLNERRKLLSLKTSAHSSPTTPSKAKKESRNTYNKNK